LRLYFCAFLRFFDFAFLDAFRADVYPLRGFSYHNADLLEVGQEFAFSAPDYFTAGASFLFNKALSYDFHAGHRPFSADETFS
jgi:hypothetical protein